MEFDWNVSYIISYIKMTKAPSVCLLLKRIKRLRTMLLNTAFLGRDQCDSAFLAWLNPTYQFVIFFHLSWRCNKKWHDTAFTILSVFIVHVFAPFTHLWLSHYIITWWRGLFRAPPHLVAWQALVVTTANAVQFICQPSHLPPFFLPVYLKIVL